MSAGTISGTLDFKPRSVIAKVVGDYERRRLTQNLSKFEREKKLQGGL
jgi:hypothetical protein